MKLSIVLLGTVLGTALADVPTIVAKVGAEWRIVTVVQQR